MKQLIKFSFLITILVMIGCNDKEILVPTNGPKLNIGDHYHGGVVIYVDGSQRHGLVAMDDVSYSYYSSWSSGFATTGATLTGIYEGASNTNVIISYYGTSNAAGMCDQATISTYARSYSDWYLPSKDELNLVYQNRNSFEYPPSGYYWSSTEASSSSAWVQDLSYGSVTTNGKTSNLNVIPVRKF